MQNLDRLKFLFPIISPAFLLCCYSNLANERNEQTALAKNLPTPVNTVSEPSRKPWEDTLVTPGFGTDSVHLNMSREDFVKLLGKPNEEYDYRIGCTYSDAHWFPQPNTDGSVDDLEIFAFFKDGSAFEIYFVEGFHTAGGIGPNTSLKDLRAKVNAPLYRLTNSSNTATNYQDLFFMIEKERGIAYELAVGYKTRARGVSGIYVFQPNSDFLPWGCISENQQLIEISY